MKTIDGRPEGALHDRRRPLVAQAQSTLVLSVSKGGLRAGFWPANGRRAALKGCATFYFAACFKVLRFATMRVRR